MLLLSSLLAVAPAPTAYIQATGNPFAEGTSRPERAARRRATATRSARRSSSGGGGVHYANCTAARDAGAAPVRRGDPGYRPALDRDSDGVGCE